MALSSYNAKYQLKNAIAQALDIANLLIKNYISKLPQNSSYAIALVVWIRSCTGSLCTATYHQPRRLSDERLVEKYSCGNCDAVDQILYLASWVQAFTFDLLRYVIRLEVSSRNVLPAIHSDVTSVRHVRATCQGI